MSAIGKIVKSNSHIDYVCQVYGPGEISPTPGPARYAFGSFVAIEPGRQDETNGGATLIAVVYNTQLMNPDFGSYGPRLSSREELQVFSPDYLVETATLVGLLTVGMMDASGQIAQGVPAPAGDVNAPVRSLSNEEFQAFHATESGGLSLRYMPVLMAQENPLIPSLLLTILERLETVFPHESSRLAVMRNNLAWRRVIGPLG